MGIPYTIGYHEEPRLGVRHPSTSRCLRQAGAYDVHLLICTAGKCIHKSHNPLTAVKLWGLQRYFDADVYVNETFCPPETCISSLAGCFLINR